VARAVAHLQEALLRSAAATCEPVAPVLAREFDPELLEPVDRVGCLGGQHLDEAHVGRLVTRAPDVLGVLLGRVVHAEGGLDAALCLGRVARLQRALGGDGRARPGPLGGDGGGETRGPAADDEHVEGLPAHAQKASKD
jgi:hypothetical protein